MKINIEAYLSKEEIKEICANEVKRHVREVIGEVSVSSDKSRVLIGKLAKELAKEGVQEIIPNFKELINAQIQSEIEKIKLSEMFWEAFGWKSTGNKILVEVLNNNKALLDAKMKELFKIYDK